MINLLNRQEVILNSKQELKPCPFCGSEAVIDSIYKRIYCIGCQSQMLADTHSHFLELIPLWNKRFNKRVADSQPMQCKPFDYCDKRKENCCGSWCPDYPAATEL